MMAIVSSRAQETNTKERAAAEHAIFLGADASKILAY